LIRWITPSVGTAPWLQSATDVGTEKVDVRELVDGSGNSEALVQAKIEQAIAILEAGRKVVVCCDLGMSRSNAIAAGVLSRIERRPFPEAVRQVAAATRETRIKVELLGAVARALKDKPATRAVGVPRVAVLGGTGFVGKALSAQLSGRAEVVSLDRSHADLSVGAVELYLSTVAHGADVIVHLAYPRVVDNRGLGDALTMLRNTLDVCRETGAALVHLSGADVFNGHVGNEGPVGEDVARKPADVVGETKALCEELIEHHVSQHGIRVLLIRAAKLYDDRGTRPILVRKFVDLAMNNHRILTHRCRNGAPILDLVHIEDAAHAIAELIMGREQGTFHLGAGDTISTGDLAQRIVQITGSRSAIGETAIDTHCANIVLNGSKVTKQVGWRPEHRFLASLDKVVASITLEREALR
jgi:UDP-glucuronate decarboxylase